MHWFIEPIQNHYADFSGRSSREAYWMFTLFVVIISVVLSLIEAPFLMYIFALALLIPNIAITVRRLHDIGKSGAWYFIGFIPLIGFLVMIYFLIQKSQPGDNQYGPSPLTAGTSGFVEQTMMPPNPPMGGG